MADNNNFTIWQRLTKVFGPDSTLDQQAPVYNFDKKQILKTTDKKEYERLEKDAVMDCIECGSCSFTCPATRPLLDYIRLGKGKVGQIMRARK